MRFLGFLLAAFVTVIGASTRPAAAQHCHVPDAVEAERAWWLRGSATVVAGSTDLLGETREYQGLGVAVQAGTGRFSGRVALPAYRIASDRSELGDPTADAGPGLGDATLAAAVDLLPRGARSRAGLTATLGLPTGNADRGRGMGHVMVTGGGWLRRRHGRAGYGVSAVWSRTLGDDAAHAAHARGGQAGWPLVDPMNPSELMIDVSALVAVVPGHLRTGTSVTYATPVEVTGERRLVAAAVAEVLRGPYTLGLQVGVPLIGDPYVARGTLELAYRY